MIPVKHPFGTYAAIKNVCAFVPTEEDEEKYNRLVNYEDIRSHYYATNFILLYCYLYCRAKDSGAFLAGGEALLKEIIKGRVDLVRLNIVINPINSFKKRIVLFLDRD